MHSHGIPNAADLYDATGDVRYFLAAMAGKLESCAVLGIAPTVTDIQRWVEEARVLAVKAHDVALILSLASGFAG